MGCCQGKANFGAFKHELGVPLLEDVAPKLSRADESRVFVVRLSSMKDIPIGDSFTSNTDSFAELKLVPNDPIAGMQRQVSSIKPQSRNPKWVREPFFVLYVVLYFQYVVIGSSRTISICCFESKRCKGHYFIASFTYSIRRIAHSYSTFCFCLQVPLQ